jgi:hypothetical protein
MTSDALCEHCKALIIDDNELDETELENGDLVLGGDEILLKYCRRDTYPEFPDLQRSAENGCTFCGPLRKLIQDLYGCAFQKIVDEWEDHLDKDVGLSMVVEIDGLRYLRHNNTTRSELLECEYNGICALAGVLHVPDAGLVHMEEQHWTFSFEVCAEAGIARAMLDDYTSLTGSIDDAAAEYLRIHQRPINHDVLSPENLESWKKWIFNCRQAHSVCQHEVDRPSTAKLAWSPLQKSFLHAKSTCMSYSM